MRLYERIDFGPHGVVTFPAISEVAKEAAGEPDPNSVFDPLLAFVPSPAPAAKTVPGDAPNDVMDGVFAPLDAFFDPKG